ncbi:copper resistance system multicopper oxidase [Parasphingorhabdus halotolerans]|uniref:Copper resistance system multicopper oxidase n=1 Tax=Parasphingorhabdus halotolerans TaxID=2725558 RepID=A0A6H2DMW7_9SPHN|nr:copper resistance system multicopper oxidase [Parasphingorhabdus halotolerans]QJB69006.1 copper resistance system multicopper oxidase [Parasphingorhabdus halotolerans]
MNFSRRAMIGSLAALSSTAALPMPAWAKGRMNHKMGGAMRKGIHELSGSKIDLHIGDGSFATGGRSGHAIAVNGSVPGPLIRLKEGQDVTLSVHNMLNVDSSIHWHGLLLPFQFDGVPGISFPGIKPGARFDVPIKLRQSGTYWWHSHSGLQEQSGHYGPIIIDPAGEDPVRYDREHIILLSEFTPMHPHQIMKKLKVSEGYFSQQKTAAFDDYDFSGEERRMWGQMRMMPTDIADVSAPTYTYLINGHGPDDGLELPYKRGERVRLRIINGSAMTFFNVRLPGLPMTVVQADGINVQPVEVDELQIGVAETYDVIVTPSEDGAFALAAESMDRSGMAQATLTSQPGRKASFPELRDPPLLSMTDMGHGGMAEGGHGGHGGGMDHSKMDHAAMDHAMPDPAPAADHSGHDMSAMDMSGGMTMRDTNLLPDSVEVGPGIDMVAMNPQDRTGYPGLGLDNVPHRVLNYRMLKSVEMDHNKREPDREMELHLTGNMERYMWSLDGKKFSAVGDDPIRFGYNERVRVKLVNDTMMAHPIHLHGMFFELVNGQGHHQPKKHTVIVQPGSSATFDVTTDEPGDWAFHCHLLYHMHAGMMQTVSVAFPKDA